MHILVTNAGVYGPMGAIEDVDWDAWTKAVEINLYGTILPIRAIIPHFKANGGGKIVNLSGGGATSPLPNISAYAASKSAVVRMTETLAGELAAHKITVNAVAPGALNTPLQDELLAAGPDGNPPKRSLISLPRLMGALNHTGSPRRRLDRHASLTRSAGRAQIQRDQR